MTTRNNDTGDIMKNVAFLFPGQGSQSVGMGEDIYQAFPEAREIFETAEHITDMPVRELCFKGPMDRLTQTVNLQPAVTAVNLAYLSLLNREGIFPSLTAGHSLGEYSALCAAGVISETDTLKLVYRRGALMHREAEKNKGAMHAIVGLPIEALQEIVASVQPEGVVAIANHNTEKQIVITGAPAPVEKVSAAAIQKGARSIPLKVSGAWHSRLIEGAQQEFENFLSDTAFSTPKCDILMNVTGETVSEPDAIRAIMARQLCSPVRWYPSMQSLMARQIKAVVEVGPGKVLAGLMKQILPKDYPCKIYTVNSLKNLEQAVQEIQNTVD